MNYLNVFIKANRALEEGNYEEFVTYCTQDIKWENPGLCIFNAKTELLNNISQTYRGTTFTPKYHQRN